MIAGYKAILCSPDFLMIGLESGVPQTAQLGDYALASRLSFFLWNSLPDATLLELQRQGLMAPGARVGVSVGCAQPPVSRGNTTTRATTCGRQGRGAGQ